MSSAPRSPREVRRIDGAGDLGALIPAWSDLLGRAARASATQTPAWLCAWWRTFGGVDGRRLRGFTFWDDGRLVALAPLLERKTRHRAILPFRRVELLATGEDEDDEICSDYIGIIAEAGYEAKVAESLAVLLLEERDTWDDVVLTMMDGDAPMTAALERAMAAAGLHVEHETCGVCPFVPLPRTFERFLKGLDGRSRYVVTRALRELDAWAGPGGAVLHRAGSRAELPGAIQILHELHEARWRTDGQGGVFARERFRRFHDEVMSEMVDGAIDSPSTPLLDLLWLEVAGRPVAALYNFVYRRKVSVYQCGRAQDVPKGLRIGIAMNALAIRDAIDRGCREYDFLNGASQYKRQLSSGHGRELVTLRVVSPTARAHALEAARAATERAIGRVRTLRDHVRRPPARPPASAASI